MDGMGRGYYGKCNYNALIDCIRHFFGESSFKITLRFLVFY